MKKQKMTISVFVFRFGNVRRRREHRPNFRSIRRRRRHCRSFRPVRSSRKIEFSSSQERVATATDCGGDRRVQQSSPDRTVDRDRLSANRRTVGCDETMLTMATSVEHCFRSAGRFEAWSNSDRDILRWTWGTTTIRIDVRGKEDGLKLSSAEPSE